MADIDGSVYPLDAPSSGPYPQTYLDGAYYGLVSSEGGVAVTKYYKMRASDDGVAAPGYVTWVVTDDPDFAGVGFSGGSPTPVGSMVAGSAQVVAEWEE